MPTLHIRGVASNGNAPRWGGGLYPDDDLVLEVLLVFWPSRHIFCQQLFRHMNASLTFLFICGLTRASSDRQTGESERWSRSPVTLQTIGYNNDGGKRSELKLREIHHLRAGLENPDKSG